ncbi:hypothetical protein MKEN_00785900 [Mycena kentingensis (nom. inval.)]|nr:hypothetical protein MKEN_00785900 [Mycena kentingensis (nom. inval.)]
MAPGSQPAKYQYIYAAAGKPKIVPVDEPLPAEESAAEYNHGGYLPIKLSDSFKAGRYCVVRKLGWGHFSTVWLVKDQQLNRHSALKVVKSAGRYAETARDEIKLLSKVAAAAPNHPGRQHVVSFMDSFTHEGPDSSHICIVFEPLGENLLALIERNRRKGVPRALVKVIAKQVLLGLEYLHDELDLVHTDLKPENILIAIPDVEEYICSELIHSPSPTSRRPLGSPRSAGPGSGSGPNSYNGSYVSPVQMSHMSKFGVNGLSSSAPKVPSGLSASAPRTVIPASSKSTPVTAANSHANSPTSPPSTSSSSSSISSTPFTTAGSVSTPPTSLSNSFGSAMAGLLPTLLKEGRAKTAPNTFKEPIGVPMKKKRQSIIETDLEEALSSSWKEKLGLGSGSLSHKATASISGKAKLPRGHTRSSSGISVSGSWKDPGLAAPAPAVVVSVVARANNEKDDDYFDLAETLASSAPSSQSSSCTVTKAHPSPNDTPVEPPAAKSTPNPNPSLLSQTAPRIRNSEAAPINSRVSPPSHNSQLSAHMHIHAPLSSPALDPLTRPVLPTSPSSATSLTPTAASPPLSSPPPDLALPHLHTPALALPKARPNAAPQISIKIADLGNATPSKKHFTEDIQTRQYRCPEAIIGRKDWGTRVDVWSVACLVFELLTAEFLFDPQGQADLFTKDDDHMAQIIELLGDFPLEIKMGGKYSAELFDSTGSLRYIKTLKPWPLKRVMTEKYLWSKADADLLCTFLQPMLAIDPRNRADAKDMLDHRTRVAPINLVRAYKFDNMDADLDVDDVEHDQATLNAFLASLPYKCESPAEMDHKLADIISKMHVCVQARNWGVLTTWDGVLESWMGLRYPISKPLRAKLAKFYFELILLPGIEARSVRSWVHMFNKVLKPGVRRKLEPADLQLAWQPLWRLLKKELWPSGRKRTDLVGRNMVNLLLFTAEHARPYFPPAEIEEMLATFLPLVTKTTIVGMFPVLVSFLPPTHTHRYLPTLFTLARAFNSTLLDERMLELVGELAEEHVAGTAGPAGEQGGAQWKDVGIYTEADWNFLVGKGLTSMDVPVGSNRNASTTSTHADMQHKWALRIKKTISRQQALARLLVYSLAVDGPVRDSSIPTPRTEDGKVVQPVGFVAGSKALDTLDRIITSLESFFHPSNSGPYTIALTSFLQYLSAFFCQRKGEEEEASCVTPVGRRLTPSIRRAFVTILRTPTLLAMFSKDPLSMACAQATLRALSMLEPGLIMPQLLERAYGGLEAQLETHRTTAVLTMLNAVSRPLVTEKLWLGGQKHLLPLLELSLPGIDLNDPAKTSCATTFIVAAIQHIRVADLSDQPAIYDDEMEVEAAEPTPFPTGTELGDMPMLSKDEERALVRDGTANFADWVTTLFRRVLALYENLPEEGGQRNTTGGKTEQTVLSSIKSMIDIVCLHLSDKLFDLVLKLVFDYGATNAKSNAVKAFGQLIGCLARVRPEATLAKFLPHCVAQVEEELKHGASSMRTTSSNAAVPSDTTLHWNMAILRGCLGYGGAAILKYREQVLGLVSLLVDKTMGERGYSGTGRLVSRILHNVAGVYPINSRFLNTAEWQDPALGGSSSWGRFYKPEDVSVEWHVPSEPEIEFVLDILDRIETPALDKVEQLLATTSRWGPIERNDFCRYLHACRAIWSGLPTIIKEQPKDVPNSLIRDDVELAEMLVSHIDIEAGFALTDPADARYQRVANARTRFGDVVQRAANALRQNTGGEDHIDAIMGVGRAIDVYLMTYAVAQSTINSLQKNYTQARDANRVWNQQKENSRLVFIKRCQVYHCNRLYMHSLYRKRSELDDKLIDELVELSLSPYTRIRRQAQGMLLNVSGTYLRSTRHALSTLLLALGKGNDPDRMKGALYLLSNKSIMIYALNDLVFQPELHAGVLECQHEEKPSIQKLVGTLANNIVSHIKEEAGHTDAFTLGAGRVTAAIAEVVAEASATINQQLVAAAKAQSSVRASRRNEEHTAMIQHILEIANRPKTHWRYAHIATRFLSIQLRRDVAPIPGVVKWFLENTLSPQPSIRNAAQAGLVKMLEFIKMRTYSSSTEQLWLDEWTHPLETRVSVGDPTALLDSLAKPVEGGCPYVDKFQTGFLLWTPTIKAYAPVPETGFAISWDAASLPTLQLANETIFSGGYFEKLADLWAQESTKNGNVEVRGENLTFIKVLAKVFGPVILQPIIPIIDPLLTDQDKFKQRAGAELLSGIWRGSKHWPPQESRELWAWSVTKLNEVLPQIKPDTFPLWQTAVSNQVQNRDPRRSQPLMDWILNLPLEFNADSAFSMSKSLYLFGLVADGLGVRFHPRADDAVNMLLDNANNGYNEIRAHVSAYLHILIRDQWVPTYPSLKALLSACENSEDPLGLRVAKYNDRVAAIVQKLPDLKEKRLAPPRVSQSEYDKIGLTLLQWVWISAYSSHAARIFPYAVPMMPEILHMSELNDSSDLQIYSSAVLYVLSAVAVPEVYVSSILENFVNAIKSSSSWRIRLHALPALVVFFYRNLLSISPEGVAKVMDVLLDCLADPNVERIVPLKNRFLALARKTTLPGRRDPGYADALRALHSAILGLCALIESFPYTVEPWMPPLTEVLAAHATDPPPISTTIKDCAADFKKTHQDTWHTDQLLFDEDQLQNLSTMLVGTSYYA